MKNIAIFYSSGSGDTKRVADMISEEFDNIKEFDIRVTGSDYFNDYENIILGVSTYTNGQLQLEWQKIWEQFCKINFKNKKVAIFALGDQKKYPDNFVDSMGILFKQLKKTNAIIIGFTSIDGYSFNSSKGIIEDKFAGLAIDLENQEKEARDKVKTWVGHLKNSFN